MAAQVLIYFFIKKFFLFETKAPKWALVSKLKIFLSFCPKNYNLLIVKFLINNLLNTFLFLLKN